MLSLADGLQIAMLVAFIHMSGFYLLSLLRRDASVVDIGWGLGIVAIAWTLKGLVDEKSIGFNLMILLVSLWGARLAWHILNRKLKKPGEDWRYQKMREDWGRHFIWQSYFKIFMLQAFLTLLVALPLITAAVSHADFDMGPWLAAGTAVWAVGYYFEVVGDWQLGKFIKKKQRRKQAKKGKQVMTGGLWRYTRHPNYFGEVTQWWGLFIMTIGLSYFWLALISPLTITFLLLKVSGIPLLESRYEGDKEFEKYKKRTNAFFPGPQKK